jgi:hypothetical protein
MSDVRTQGEAAEMAARDAYAAHPGVGIDASAVVRDPAGDYTVVSDGSGKLGPQPPVEYAGPGPASGGRFGEGA